MALRNYSLLFCIGLGLFAHCGSSNSQDSDSVKTSITESIPSQNKAGENPETQPEKISDYFQEVPEFYLPIPFNRRLAVLNAASAEQSVTIKVSPQKVMRYYRGELDDINAYLKIYSVNDGLDYQMTYWNQSDGNRLIALAKGGGYEEGEVADAIFFFRRNQGKWEEVKSLVPTIKLSDFLPAAFLQKYQLDANQKADFYYVLPQKGKDINIHFNVYA
ncbi:MAG: hypothetical protein ACKVTZ_22985, partial [Bacteroidia bacterium]